MKTKNLMLAALLCTSAPSFVFASNWTGFRGESFSHSDAEGLPQRWSEDTGIEWRVTFPGEGQSSPVVWGDRIFVTSIEGPQKETLWVHCVSMETGALLWSEKFASSFEEENTDYVSKAAPTPLVDGEGLYVFFESGDLIAMTHGGSLVWHRDLVSDYGPFLGNHGIGGSPAQTEEGVILSVDHDGPSYIAMFSKADGETLWKTGRDNSTAWSSPAIYQNTNGVSEILVSSGGSVDGYRVQDGRRLWTYGAVEGNNVPSVSVDNSVAVIGSRERGSNQAIQIRHAEAEVSVEQLWAADRVTSTFGSPLVADGRAYFVNRVGVVTCVDLHTGEELFEERLAQSNWASPLAAKNALYFFGDKGVTTVLAPESEFKVLAENSIALEPEDRVLGYAVVQNAFILRTDSGLMKIVGSTD